MLHIAEKPKQWNRELPVSWGSGDGFNWPRTTGSRPRALPSASRGSPVDSASDNSRVLKVAKREAFTATNSTTVTVQFTTPASNCIQYKDLEDSLTGRPSEFAPDACHFGGMKWVLTKFHELEVLLFCSYGTPGRGFQLTKRLSANPLSPAFLLIHSIPVPALPLTAV